METKLTLDPNIVLKCYKALGSENFVLVMLASAYYVKYHKRLPKNFDVDLHPEAYIYFTRNVQPILDGKPVCDDVLDEAGQAELITLINHSDLFDQDERKVLNDMLELWWGRKSFSRTEMIYTQKMCYDRTGVQSEKFCELRKWLKAEGALTWENKPYGDYNTSYHTFNEVKLLEVLKNND